MRIIYGPLLFICLAMGVCQDVAAKETTHYTLIDLCRAANENAEKIRIAEDEVEIARQDKQRAKSVLIPRATAFGSYTRYKDTGIFSPDTATAGIRLNQSFTLNGRELIAYDVAKKGIETNAFTLETIRAAYLLEVAMAYFEALEAKRMLEIAGQTIRYEKGEYWPQLSLETGYRKSDVSYGSSLMGMDTGSNNEETYAMAELRFTLFDGGLRSAQIRQAEAGKRQAYQQLIQAQNDIVLETRVAFSEYETAQKTLINLADELKSAQENYHAVQMQYRYGMADIVDMMDANTLLVQSERRISNARYALFQTIFRLLYIKGDLPAHVLE